MKHIDRIRAVTANYFLWQGLRMSALGPILIISGLNILQPSWYPFNDETSMIPLLGATVIGWLGFMAAGRYYEKTFGMVRGLRGQHANRDTVKWFIVYPLMFGVIYLETQYDPKIGISGIVWAAATLAFWWSTGRGRLHYVPAAMLIALTALFPLLGIVRPGSESVGALITVVGAIYIINGWLDHLELLRILPPAREDEHAATI